MNSPPSDTMAERGMVACARALAAYPRAQVAQPVRIGGEATIELKARSLDAWRYATGPKPILFTQHGPREI